MRISMHLIEDHLNAQQGAHPKTYFDRSKGHSKFHSLRLIDQDKLNMQSGVLYVGTVAQIASLKINGKSGLVTIGSVDAVSCDVLEFSETTDLTQLFNQLLAIFEHFNRWEKRLDTVAATPDQINDILTIAQEEIRHPMYVVNAGYKVLGMTSYLYEMEDMSATWHYLSEHGYMPIDILMDLNRSKELQRKECINHSVRVSSEHFYTPFINHAIFEKYEFMGHFFVVEFYSELDETVLELSDFVGTYIKQAILQSNDRFTGEFHENFLSDMIKSKPMDDGIRNRQLKTLGWSSDSYCCIAYYESQVDSLMTLRSIAASIKATLKCESLVRANNVTIIIARDSLRETKEAIDKLSRFAKRTRTAFGLSDIFFGIERLDVYYQQSVVASRSNASKLFGGFPYSLCFKKEIVEALDSSHKIRAFGDPAILYLNDYDANHGSPYCETIKTYLENERHLVKTAEALNIHRNTLLYRLDKIQALTDIDFDNPDVRKRLVLTFDIIEHESQDE